jgi:hypothetical protein
MRADTYEMRTAFSAVMRSCNGLKSLFPARDGNVELCAILVTAVLNMACSKCLICNGRG